ncbi:fructose 1,6-bisphosphatase [Paenibacillus nasutitermitis]|uniref:Fructose 1,6-bisphosphatase n=1 Tax=Paenibacillus nasutitermitis TaxID=1652958 RepID=A0A916YZY4_9BACL|nr:histidine phosphatase family protein [Paenibacillus nasutitermitis]GGD69090.1 fructose 1,6-bisphosphatase [Paenibacillus nasutitermitis]
MRLGLIRHGRTDWNALGKIQGQTDIALNAEGIRQAHALAARLSNEEMRWDGIVTSDLSRARETGRIIAQKLGIPLLPPDSRLRERYYGAIEGTTDAERMEKWGPDWRKSDSGQETDEAVRSRALSFVEEAASSPTNPNILAVTHGSLLAQLMQAMCSNLEDKPIVNMSFSVMERVDQDWKPLLHNCALHLEQPHAGRH